MTWSRRAFVRWGLAAGGVAVLGRWAWGRRDRTDFIVAILERRIGYLQVDRETFRPFARSYIAADRGPGAPRPRLAIASMVAQPLQWVRPDRWGGPIGRKFRQLEDSVVGTYLLSTDFFDHGADELRVVTYREPFGPLAVACRNPFARQAGTDS